MFEIVDLRITDESIFTDFIVDNIRSYHNLVENYYSMTKKEFSNYNDHFNQIVDNIEKLETTDNDKYYLNNFMNKLYFGTELSISEIVEFFVILNIDTINIIDNTCRVNEDWENMVYSKTPSTREIEFQEKFSITPLREKKGGKNKTRKMCKNIKNKLF
jgi:hypothetical protein